MSVIKSSRAIRTNAIFRAGLTLAEIAMSLVVIAVVVAAAAMGFSYASQNRNNAALLGDINKYMGMAESSGKSIKFGEDILFEKKFSYGVTLSLFRAKEEIALRIEGITSDQCEFILRNSRTSGTKYTYKLGREAGDETIVIDPNDPTQCTNGKIHRLALMKAL